MINLETRTTNPSLSYHIQHYLDATESQRSLGIPLREWFDLDHTREAAMTAIALEMGLVETVPIDGILPPDIWNKAIDVVYATQT